MKTKLLIALVLFGGMLQAQRKPKIKGNKNVVEVREQLPPFTAVELNDDLDIVLRKSNSNGYTINADDNLIDVLKFRVEDNGTLVISSFYKITGKKKLEISVDFEQLDAITVRTGKVDVEGIVRSDELYVNTYENAKLNLDASAAVASINMEGNSSGDMKIDADSLQLRLKDRIDVRIYSTGETAVVDMSQNASVKMEGNMDVLELRMVESSGFKAKEFRVGTINADLTGNVLARIHAYDGLTLSSRGSAKTQLYGNPQITLAEFLNTSQLLKKE